MKRLQAVIMILVLLCISSACGNEKEKSEDSLIEIIDYEAEYQAEEINDVINEAWNKTEEEKTDSAMLLSEYIANVFTRDFDAETFNLGYCSDSQNIYLLRQYYFANEAKAIHCLYSFNGNSKVTSMVQYDLDEQGLPGMLYEPYAVDGRVFSSFIAGDESTYDLSSYRCVELLEDGSVTPYADVIEILKDNDWMPKPQYIPEVSLRYEPITGHTYILSPEKDRLIIADESGKVINEFRGFNENGRCQISFYTLALDGYIILLCEENGNETFFTFDNNSISIMYEGKRGPEADGVYQIVDGHGRILYLKNYHTVTSWDTKTGVQETLYKSGGDYAYGSGGDAFTRNDNGELIILVNNNVRVISYEGKVNPVEITLKPLGLISNTIRQCIKRYEETHPGVKITILFDTKWDSRDSELNIVYAEISNGEGPDMMQVLDDQLVHLIKSNCLYDLSDILKPEIKEALIPAVVKEEQIDGKKYRFGMNPEIRTFVVNKKYCPNGSLSIGEILDIIEAREREGNPFEYIVVGDYSHDLFEALVSTICDSEFIDMDNYECHFDSEDFIHLLKVCKEYREKEKTLQYSKNDSSKLMKEDKALLYFESNMDIYNFSSIWASLGDDYTNIGFPVGNNQNKNILCFPIGGIVVNSASMQDEDKRKIIEDLLNCMYTPEYLVDTIASTVPTRLDAFEGRIVDDYPTGSSIKIDGRTTMPIAGKADGSSYVSEYLELLNSCDSLFSKDAGALKRIVVEEAEYYFDGPKSAEEVAKIIQGRVELYLMELQ